MLNLSFPPPPPLVILSAAKNPRISSLLLHLLLSVFFFSQTTTRHFDRSCSQPPREQHSGEIRFSTWGPLGRSLRLGVHSVWAFTLPGRSLRLGAHSATKIVLLFALRES